MKKATEDILIAFCIHEKLHFPTVKKIFQQQTQLNQQIGLRDMQKTIKLAYPNNKAYAQFIKSASNDTKRSSLESPRTNGIKKDD